MTKVLLGSIRGPIGLSVVDWINPVDVYGADPTGGTDSTTDIQSAINDCVTAGGGTVYLPKGTYKVSSTLTVAAANVYIRGAGLFSTVINYYGSGDCIRMYSPLVYTSGFAGGGYDFMVDGTNSTGSGAAGIHAGDIYQLCLKQVGVRKFRLDATAKGFWFDNQYTWTEEMTAEIWVEQNANNIVFDNSANLSAGLGYLATGSFKGLRLDATMDAKGSGNGVVVQGGAEIYNFDAKIFGNIDWAGSSGQGPFSVIKFVNSLPAFTATHASPCVFTVTGGHPYNGQTANLVGASLPGGFAAVTAYYVVNTNPAAGTFQLSATSGGSAIASTTTGSGTIQFYPYSTFNRGRFNVGVELNAITAFNQPYSIDFGPSGQAPAAGIFQSIGIMDFSGNNPFRTNDTSWGGNFQFDGPVYGDNKMLRTSETGRVQYGFGTASNGSIFYTRYASLLKATTASSATVTGCSLQVGTLAGAQVSQTFTLINIGTGAIQFAASGSNVFGGSSIVIAPGTAATFVWESDSGLWYKIEGSAQALIPKTDLSVLLAPTGATAETFPRSYAGNYTAVLASGTVHCSAIPLPAGLTVNNLGVLFGNTAFATTTHGWYALLDSSFKVLAVTADQTSAFNTSFANLKIAVGASYVTTYTGVYYIAFCAVSGTMGTISSGPASTSAPNLTLPYLCGRSNTGSTTPPTVGTTLTALAGASGDAAFRFYGYTA